jgi:hypothetical protein
MCEIVSIKCWKKRIQIAHLASEVLSELELILIDVGVCVRDKLDMIVVRRKIHNGTRVCSHGEIFRAGRFVLSRIDTILVV